MPAVPTLRPATVRPFRFSSPAGSTNSVRDLRERARLLEDLGYSTITVSDHFDSQLGPIAALAAAAEATTTLRVAPLVFCNDFRHPVTLAKEAATIDLISDGRLEFGIGAGWREADYDESGMPYDRAGVRIERMAEALAVIRGLWADGPFDYDGAHYRVRGLDGTPKPAQRPSPPVIIGGGGRKILGLAGREADIVGLNPSLPRGRIDASAGPTATPAATDAKLAWVRDAAGDRYDDLEIQCRLQLAAVTDDPQGLVDLLAAGVGLTDEEAKGTPHALIGTVDHMVETLIERRERWGISYIGVPSDAAAALAPVVAALAGR